MGETNEVNWDELDVTWPPVGFEHSRVTIGVGETSPPAEASGAILEGL